MFNRCPSIADVWTSHFYGHLIGEAEQTTRLCRFDHLCEILISRALHPILIIWALVISTRPFLLGEGCLAAFVYLVGPRGVLGGGGVQPLTASPDSGQLDIL